MRERGFSLVEVLAALVILAVAYAALLHLHTLALHTLSRAEARLEGVLRLELFLSGESVEGVEEESRTFRVRGLPFEEVTYRTQVGHETVYYRILRQK